MPDFKKIEKAAKLFEKLKALDAEIIEIDKHAMQIANDEVLVNLSMNIIKENEKANANEAIPRSISSMMEMYMLPSHFIQSREPTKIEEIFHYEATSKEALLIFGIILQSRIAKRDSILKQLELLQ